MRARRPTPAGTVLRLTMPDGTQKSFRSPYKHPRYAVAVRPLDGRSGWQPYSTHRGRGPAEWAALHAWPLTCESKVMEIPR